MSYLSLFLVLTSRSGELSGAHRDPCRHPPPSTAIIFVVCARRSCNFALPGRVALFYVVAAAAFSEVSEIMHILVLKGETGIPSRCQGIKGGKKKWCFLVLCSGLGPCCSRKVAHLRTSLC